MAEVNQPIKGHFQYEIRTIKKKDGGEFTACFIKITDRTEKMVFLDPAELELLQLRQSK